MKQKKIRKGFIPDDVLNKEHDPKDFIEVNIRTDIHIIRDNLKSGERTKKRQEINPASFYSDSNFDKSQ